MFVKMLLAFVVSMCLAGAAVYYGLPDFVGSNVAMQADQTSKSQKYLNKFIKKQAVKEVKPSEKVAPINTIPEAITPTEIKPDPVTIAPFSKEINRDYQADLDQLMEQASRIKAANLKDQAYLDIATYATQSENYDVADIAMREIEQKELRDTARGNTAIFMARAGMTKEAFALVDEVEIETLRDVMRLQVIEAIVMPNQMPPAIQPPLRSNLPSPL